MKSYEGGGSSAALPLALTLFFKSSDPEIQVCLSRACMDKQDNFFLRLFLTHFFFLEAISFCTSFSSD